MSRKIIKTFEEEAAKLDHQLQSANTGHEGEMIQRTLRINGNELGMIFQWEEGEDLFLELELDYQSRKASYTFDEDQSTELKTFLEALKSKRIRLSEYEIKYKLSTKLELKFEIEINNKWKKLEDVFDVPKPSIDQFKPQKKLNLIYRIFFWLISFHVAQKQTFKEEMIHLYI